MSNPNLWVWTTDWHVTSDDSEAGILGETKPKEAAAVVSHINGLNPAGVIDTGDCKDHYGLSTSDEHDNYIRYVRSKMSWATVNPGFNAKYPILPGNHDEVDDYSSPDNGTEFSMWDSKFWPAPYHWTCDWAAPKIRFIAMHAYIMHAPNGLAGGFSIDQVEIDWMTAQIAALPAGWKAIVCSHPPALPAFGENIWTTLGGTNLIAALAANNTKIVAYLNGHRHNQTTAVQDGICHFNVGSMAYTQANGFGGFMVIEFLPGSNTLRFHYRYGPETLYGAFNPGQYTPIDISL